MAFIEEQEKIVAALQKRLNEAILNESPPEMLAVLSKAVREAAGALKDLKDW